MTGDVRLEPHWIDVFDHVFGLCAVQAGDVCAVLSETASRRDLVQLAQLELARRGARWFHVVLPQRPVTTPVPVRSTGASDAIAGVDAVVAALAQCSFVADCTVEGLMHAPELPAILAGGARVLYVSHEHPEILERCVPQPGDDAPVREAMRRLKGARRMTVTSAAGTALEVGLDGARVGGVWGYTSKPGTLSHWPGSLVLAFPAAGRVRGTLVLDRGDVNLTFKRYLADPVRLLIDDDHVVDVVGDSPDGEMLRGHYAAWAQHEGHRGAYAVSHVG
ncbi:MAG: peptidase M29, partial [Rubrivivax sp.]|nr:peptidase M29 [Rubrivivax sp.]